MGMLEYELQKIHDAGIGVSIAWLWDGGVDLRLVHKSGVVAAEGHVEAVANVLAWLERAIKNHFPKANYEHADRPLPGTPRSKVGAARREIEGEVVRADYTSTESRSRTAAGGDPRS